MRPHCSRGHSAAAHRQCRGTERPGLQVSGGRSEGRATPGWPPHPSQAPAPALRTQPPPPPTKCLRWMKFGSRAQLQHTHSGHGDPRGLQAQPGGSGSPIYRPQGRTQRRRGEDRLPEGSRTPGRIQARGQEESDSGARARQGWCGDGKDPSPGGAPEGVSTARPPRTPPPTAEPCRAQQHHPVETRKPTTESCVAHKGRWGPRRSSGLVGKARGRRDIQN